MKSFKFPDFHVFDLKYDHKIQIKDLDHADFPFPWNDAGWNSFFDDQNSLLIYWEEKSRFKGFICFGLNPFEKSAHLQKICIPKNHQGQGEGKKLLLSTLNFIKEGKFLLNEMIDFCHLEVSQKNKSAQRLYESLGFQKTHGKSNYYSNGEAAFFYRLELKL